MNLKIWIYFPRNNPKSFGNSCCVCRFSPPLPFQNITRALTVVPLSWYLFGICWESGTLALCTLCEIWKNMCTVVNCEKFRFLFPYSVHQSKSNFYWSLLFRNLSSVWTISTKCDLILLSWWGWIVRYARFGSLRFSYILDCFDSFKFYFVHLLPKAVFRIKSWPEKISLPMSLE